jgi:hypothetical protein
MTWQALADAEMGQQRPKPWDSTSDGLGSTAVGWDLDNGGPAAA